MAAGGMEIRRPPPSPYPFPLIDRGAASARAPVLPRNPTTVTIRPVEIVPCGANLSPVFLAIRQNEPLAASKRCLRPISNTLS